MVTGRLFEWIWNISRASVKHEPQNKLYSEQLYPEQLYRVRER
jgi:hypothetical protein